MQDFFNYILVLRKKYQHKEYNYFLMIFFFKKKKGMDAKLISNQQIHATLITFKFIKGHEIITLEKQNILKIITHGRNNDLSLKNSKLKYFYSVFCILNMILIVK